MVLSRIIFFTLFLINEIYEIQSEETFAPIVDIKNGKVRGIVKELDDGRKLNLYVGVPYGKAMIGELRFQKPLPASNWEGVYNATKNRNACVQAGKLDPKNIYAESKFDEDCLFLSVWQPPTPLPNGKKRSVMYWIHGGGFEEGTIFSMAYDARYLAILGDVIVVTVNYRLGPFGFLYGGTDDTPGNAGLYDQILALKWIRDNIEQFGGDPESVTIMGESAGSMSVGALILSPLSTGLFRRAIMQSGSPNSYLGSESKDHSLAKSKSLATSLNCSTTSMAEMVKCLRSKTTEEIIEISKNARANGQSFEPIYGDDLMPIKPYEALEKGKFNQNVDLMFGTVKEEGSLFVESIFPALSPDEKNPTITVSKAKQYITLMFLMFKENYGDAVADFYVTSKGLKDDEKDELRQAVSRAFGDYHLTCPTVLYGEAFTLNSKANKVYSYRVTHRPAMSVYPLCHGWMGVCHGDDVMLLFGFPIKLRGVTFTEDDYKLSLDMVHSWAIFAKTGVPPKLDNTEWIEAFDRKLTNPSVRYMDLNPLNYTIVEGFYKKTCDEFWKTKFAGK